MSQVQGSLVSTGSIQRELQDGLNEIVGLEYEDWNEEYSRILTVYDSKKNYEEDVIRAGTGLASIKNEGASIQYDDSREVGLQRYIHINYGKGIIITQEAMEDGLYLNEMEVGGQMIARSIMQTKENVAAGMFNNGYTTTVLQGWDAVALFSDAHLLGKGGTYSNILATPADLSEASLESALIAIAGYVDDAGLLIQAMGEKLFIPRQQMFQAERILASFLQSDTANNDINAIPNMGMLPQGYEVNHYFTDADNWLIRTDVPNGGKFWKRAEHVDTDNDFGTSNYRHKGTCRFSVGWTDARQYFGSGDIP